MGLLKKKSLDIQPYNIVLIQMCRVRRICFNDSASEQCFGMTSFAVISGEHVRSHGLSETAGTADADILYPGFIQFLVDQGDHTCFIYVDFVCHCLAERFVSWIEIQSHGIHLFFPVDDIVEIVSAEIVSAENVFAGRLLFQSSLDRSGFIHFTIKKLSVAR